MVATELSRVLPRTHGGDITAMRRVVATRFRPPLPPAWPRLAGDGAEFPLAWRGGQRENGDACPRSGR